MIERAPFFRIAIGNKARGISKRNNAQMAFSMVAVVILLISGIAITTITSNAIDSSSSRDESTKAAEMEAFSTDVEQHLSDSAYVIGLKVLNETYMNDPDALQTLFQGCISDSIDSGFPISRGSYVASVESYRISIALMPSAGTGGLDGTLDSRTSNLLAFFRVCGIAELNISGPQGHLLQNVSIDRPIYFPIPLLGCSWDRFSSLIEDDGSLLWKLVRYEITALVQVRLYQNAYSMNGPIQSNSVLTDCDIQNAIVLSTILLQRAVFCTYDESLLESFISPSGCILFLDDIVTMIETAGTVDPADIFLNLYRMDSVDVQALIAQSLYASADLIALKLIDYLRVADVVNSVEETIQSGVFTLRDAMAYVLGKDIENENARTWVKHKFDQAGIEEGTYRYLWNDNIDWTVSVPSFTILMLNSTGGYEGIDLGGEAGLNISPLDVLDSDLWKDFRQEYELGTDCLISAIEGMVKSISTEISSRSSIGMVTLELDPFDGLSVFEELISSVSSSLDDNEDYFLGSSARIRTEPSQDPMGVSVIGSIEKRTNDFYRYSEVMEKAYNELAVNLYESGIAQYPSMDQAPHEFNIGTLREALKNGAGGDITAQFNQLFATDTEANMVLLEEGLISSESSEPFWNDVISAMISGQVMNSIGMEQWINENIIRMLEDTKTSSDLRGGAIEIMLNPMDSLFVTNTNGQTTKVTLHLQTNFLDDLRIYITDPVKNQEGRINPNQHITDLIDGSMSPFINCWSYIVDGQFKMKLFIRSENDPRSVLQSYDGFSFINTNSDIIGSTGWPIDLVDYEATNTLDQDAFALINDIWDEFVEMFQSLGKTVSDSYDMLRSLESKSVDLASEAMEIFSALLQSSIESLQKLLRDMILEGACGLIESLTCGKNIDLIEMEMMGVHLCVELNSRDPALSGAMSIVKTSIGFALGDSTISVSSRLFRDSHRDYSFLINASLRSDQMKLAMVIDPFMSSYSHIVEIKGLLGNQYVDICMPEVVRYKQIGFSLADLPGVGTILSNIPLPIPGMKGQINAGIVIKLATDSTSGPVINEFELNPKGQDGGNEWVEIFNPTNQVISLSGWTIETMHGKKVVDDLGEILMTPHSRFVYEFDGQALDNGEPGCLPEGESIVLRDATGKRVDTAPFVPDVKNDARTWQRAHDGSETWEFRAGTKGAANSKTVNRWVNEDEVGVTLEALIVQTFEVLEASGSSLSSLGIAMQVSMANAITALVDQFAGAIIEVGLFVEVTLIDESGTAGANMRYSISADGSIVKESWAWLCSTIMDMISNPLSAMQSIGKNGLPDFIYENVWFGASSGSVMKLPKMLGAEKDLSCKVSFITKVNIAATGILIGEDIGTPKMIFGVCMTGVISEKVPLLGMQAGELVDVWLIRGTMISQ